MTSEAAKSVLGVYQLIEKQKSNQNGGAQKSRYTRVLDEIYADSDSEDDLFNESQTGSDTDSAGELIMIFHKNGLSTAQ